MKCLDASAREKLLDLIVAAELVEIVYARVEAGSIYCTLQRKKTPHVHESRPIDPARDASDHAREFFTE